MLFMKCVLLAFFSYLLGSIPGVMIAQKAAHRNLGPGATTTTVLRELGIQYALIAFGIDFFKGLAAALLGLLMVNANGLGFAVAGIFMLLGHIYNPVMGLKGSRGITPYAAVLTVINPLAGIIMTIIGLLLFALLKFYKLLAPLCTLAAAVVITVVAPLLWNIVLVWLVFLLVVFLHRKDLLNALGRNGNSSGAAKRRLR